MATRWGRATLSRRRKKGRKRLAVSTPTKHAWRARSGSREDTDSPALPTCGGASRRASGEEPGIWTSSGSTIQWAILESDWWFPGSSPPRWPAIVYAGGSERSGDARCEPGSRHGIWWFAPSGKRTGVLSARCDRKSSCGETASPRP